MYFKFQADLRWLIHQLFSLLTNILLPWSYIIGQTFSNISGGICFILYYHGWVGGRKNELKEPLNSNNFSFLQLWKRLTSSENQYSKLRSEVKVTNKDLLLMPSVSVITIKIMILQRVTLWLILKLLNFILQGGVTHDGLRHNIAVGILFIEAWLRGVCSFIIDLNM